MLTLYPDVLNAGNKFSLLKIKNCYSVFSQMYPVFSIYPEVVKKSNKKGFLVLKTDQSAMWMGTITHIGKRCHIVSQACII